MRALAEARAERRGGRTSLVIRRAEAPIAIRWSGGRALLASTAAHPVGGDEIDVRVSVGMGADLAFGSVGAMLCWPGPGGEPSVLRTSYDVEAGGHLHARPEPVVAVAGCRHRNVTRVRLAADATCRLIEETALGRTDEASGEIGLSLRVERDGLALVHHDEWFGTAASTTSVSAGHARYVLSAIEVGAASGPAVSRIGRSIAGAWLPLADDAGMLIVVGPDRPAVLDLAAELRPALIDGTAVGGAPLACAG